MDETTKSIIAATLITVMVVAGMYFYTSSQAYEKRLNEVIHTCNALLKNSSGQYQGADVMWYFPLNESKDKKMIFLNQT